MLLFRDVSVDIGGVGFNTRYRSLVIPDLSGTSVYLVVFDEVAILDYFILKYVFAQSKYFTNLVEELDFKLDITLISDTDLFLSGIQETTDLLLMTRISKYSAQLG